MALKKFKPVTPSLRFRVLLDKKNLNNIKFKFLRIRLLDNAGRNQSGSITIRHQGGSVFSFFKRVDFNRLYSKSCNVVDLTFDKKRTGLIALVSYSVKNTNSFSYLLAPEGITAEKSICTSFNFRGSNDSLGDTLPIGWIPNTKIVYNVEISPGSGGVFARSAGTFCKILRQKRDFVELKLPSGLITHLSPYSMASVGRVSNLNHRFEHYSYAGYFRHLGRRPSVRGEAMNAVDHPHGGKTRGGKPAMSPWGKILK